LYRGWQLAAVVGTPDCLASLPHSSGKPVELIYTTDDCKQSVAACLEPLWGRPDKCTLATMHGGHSAWSSGIPNEHTHQAIMPSAYLVNPPAAESCLYRSTRTRIAAPTLSQSSHSPYSPLPAAPVPTGTTSACQAAAPAPAPLRAPLPCGPSAVVRAATAPATPAWMASTPARAAPPAATATSSASGTASAGPQAAASGHASR
jgi:hypothetical protein